MLLALALGGASGNGCGSNGDDKPQPACSADADCADGEMCDGGRCYGIE